MWRDWSSEEEGAMDSGVEQYGNVQDIVFAEPPDTRTLVRPGVALEIHPPW